MEETFREALRAALRLLKARARLSSELKNRLVLKGFDEKTVDDVVHFLTERRFLDDPKTITETVQRATGKRAAGRDKILADLVARGVPESEVEGLLPADDEQQKMDEALAAKFPEGGNRAKGYRWLLSRGFDPEAAASAVGRYWTEESGDHA